MALSVNSSGDLTGSNNNLVMHQLQQQQQQQQLQQNQQAKPQLYESTNGESLAASAVQQPRAISLHYFDDQLLPSCLHQYAIPSSSIITEPLSTGVKYAAPRSCTGSPWEHRSSDQTESIHKPLYRCEENIQFYPQRCREEYNQRCSESNLMTREQRYVEQQQQEQKYWADVHRYFQRFSKDQEQSKPLAENDLKKFPQFYSEDPLRVPFVRTYKDAPIASMSMTSHCPDYQTRLGYKYHAASKNGFFTNRILSPSGLPMLGQAAIGIVVKKFGSGPLDNYPSHHQQFYHTASTEYRDYNSRVLSYNAEQSDFCPCESGAETESEDRVEEELYIDERYVSSTLLSDCDNM